MKLSCHCGNITINVPPPKKVTQCNCSICSRYNSLWAYYDVHTPQITIGQRGFSTYSWGDNELDFVRCSHCGCMTHYVTKPGQSNPVLAVNCGMARHLVSDVPVRIFDGAKM